MPTCRRQLRRIAVTILEAFHDPALFGGLRAFRDPEPWAAWRAFLAAVYGLPLGACDLERFGAHTGRSTPRVGGYSEASRSSVGSLARAKSRRW